MPNDEVTDRKVTSMRRNKHLIISALCGLLSAVAFAGFLWSIAQNVSRVNQTALKQYGGVTVFIAVADHTMQPGHVINNTDYSTKKWISQLLPSGALVESEADRLVGKKVTSLILSGEPINQNRIGKRKEPLSDIPAGLSAVTVSTDAVRSLGGQLSPGMRVDLLCPNAQDKVDVLATGVEVLYTSNTTNEKSEKKTSGLIGGGDTTAEIRWVTFAVPKTLVSQVVAAANQSNVYVALPSVKGDAANE